MRNPKKHALSGHAGYPPISILVASGLFIRIYTTHRFSIRALINDLRRCNPSFKIVAISEKPTPKSLDYLNFGWSTAGVGIDIIRNEFNGLEIDYSVDLTDLIRRYDYRMALNMLYCRAANRKEEINRNPFVGVENPDRPEKPLNIQHYPAFVSYSELGDRPWEILKWYDGRRFRRTINAELKEGYIITGARWNNARD